MLYDFPILVTREQWNWSLNPSLFELLKVWWTQQQHGMEGGVMS